MAPAAESGSVPRVLVAGVGNVLRGDDGFGIEVLARLAGELEGRPGITLFESGIAGISLVQELLAGYDALIVLDAVDRGAAPGTLFVLEPDLDALATGPRPRAVDLHQADPHEVLRMAAALGALPERGVWIIGCQAAECDELGAGLSPPVAAQVTAAAARVEEILARLAPIAGEAVARA